MEGLIFDIKHFSVHDGPGIRATVFFKGCPLRCAWCHNPESQLCQVEQYNKVLKLGQKTLTVQESIGKNWTVKQVMDEIRADIPFFDESHGGVTISGGEPLMQPQFLNALLARCKSNGIHTAVDTCGYAKQEVIEDIAGHTDLFLYDLKLVDKAQHQKYTGVSNEHILSNLELINRLGNRVFVRIPLISGITDTEQNLSAIRQIVCQNKCVERIDILPFHNIAKSKYQRFGKEYTLGDAEAYSTSKAEEIKSFFEGCCNTVSIGG